MSSKDWKALLFVSILSVGAVACSDARNTETPTSPYTGIWADKASLQNYRENGKNLNTFCRNVLRYKARIQQRTSMAGYFLNPYLIQSNGEVFTYHNMARIELESFRERHLQGVVDESGLFVFTEDTSFNNEKGILRDHTRLTLNSTGSELEAFDGRRTIEFLRTEPVEMDRYLAMRSRCEEPEDEVSDRPTQIEEDHSSDQEDDLDDNDYVIDFPK